MRIGSLFSGYGGLDLAAQQYFGGHLTWYSEIEPAACQILAAHHPIVPNLGNITAVDWATVEPVDVLTGGYPCQPFSHAGKRKGSLDERHLWPFVATAIDALRPRVVVLENVRGHITLGFGDVIAELSRMGYDASWGVVRASDAGAPHGRARIFIVAYPDRLGRRAVGASLEAGLGYDKKATAGSNVHASDTSGRSFTGSSATGNRLLQPPKRGDVTSQHSEGAAGRESGDCGSGTQVSGGTDCDAAPNADGDGHGQQQDTGRVGSVDGGNAGPSRQRQRARSIAKPRTAWGKYALAINRWERVLGRAAPDPTIVGLNGRSRLNPVFVEWMMGLDLGHVTGHGLRPAQELKALGNGVCPQQAHLALRMILGES